MNPMRRQLMRPFTTMILLAGTAPHASAANSLCASAALRDENSSRTSRTLREIKSTTYIWDDWNIIREVVRESDSVAVTDNIWGLDLDGTLQGAGGVGGLLAVIRSNSNSNSSLYFPTFDANGNISEYISTNGEIVAHYDYSPFGEPLVSSGDLAATFTHQFSTKPYCPVTEFSEYQMRKYRPEIGRWMSRDSIEEEGGLNLFGFNNNSPYIFIDNLGLHWMGGVHIVYPPFEPYCCIDNVIYVNEAVASGFKICKQYERNVGFFSGLLTHAWIETKKGNSYGFYPTITDFPKNDGFPAYRFIPSLVLSPDPYARKPKDGTITCTERYLSKCEYDFDRIEQCLKKAAKSTTKRYNVLAYNCLNWANETMNACIMEGRRKR